MTRWNICLRSVFRCQCLLWPILSIKLLTVDCGMRIICFLLSRAVEVLYAVFVVNGIAVNTVFQSICPCHVLDIRDLTSIWLFDLKNSIRDGLSDSSVSGDVSFIDNAIWVFVALVGSRFPQSVCNFAGRDVRWDGGVCRFNLLPRLPHCILCSIPPSPVCRIFRCTEAEKLVSNAINLFAVRGHYVRSLVASVDNHHHLQAPPNCWVRKQISTKRCACGVFDCPALQGRSLILALGPWWGKTTARTTILGRC